MIRVAILTMSDRGSRGERTDASGDAVRGCLDVAIYEVVHYEMIPDEQALIAEKLVGYAQKVDVILTTGGTGLSPRDVTPEATRSVIERDIPGIPEAMRARGLEFTRHSMLSRAVAGVRGGCLIINLPGSPRAVRENLEVIVEMIPHAVEKIQGSQEECAR
ncbi:MAG: MogA/MoaB family molybdenum cofactor biosynthesis protein [Thermodesulfovibrionales bacterium]